MRFVFRRLPERLGFAWWQVAVSRSPLWRFWWSEPMWQGIIRTTRVGPLWFAWMKESDHAD